MNAFMATQEYEVCGVITGGLAYCTATGEVFINIK